MRPLRSLRSTPRLVALLAALATPLAAQSLVSMPDVTNNGFAGVVTSFAISGNTLYIGGTFDSVGGSARSNLAAIDLGTGTVTAWNPGASGTVTGLGLSGDRSTLYVGGSFTTLGGDSRNYLGAVSTASGTATSWNPDLNGAVSTLTVNAATGSVYAVGDFSQAAGSTVTANRVVGITASGTVTGYGGSTTFAGSDYRSIGTSSDGSTLYLAHIGTKSWDAAAGGTASRVGFTALRTSDLLATSFNPVLLEATFASPGQSLAVVGNSLYIGGQFNNVGGVPNDSMGTTRDRIAKYDLTADGSDGTLDTAFAPTDSSNGPNSGGTRGLVEINGTLYVIGGFSAYAGTERDGLAAVDLTDGSLDLDYDVTTSSAIFGGNPTYTFGDSTTGYLAISSASITGATVLGQMQTNSFVVLSTPVSAVPEPSTYAALAGVTVLGLAAWRRRRPHRFA